jgi:geranylgeranyl diphosphate synthase type II
MNVPGVADYIRARQSEVDAALAVVLPQAPQCPEGLARAMHYSVMAGGKRVRPVLCLASAEAVGGRTEDALPAACAIEMIHTYSLIHDDLPAMDDDTLRRGQPTLHVVAGEGMAILAGDGLLTEAFLLMARAPDSSEPMVVARKLRTIRTVSTAAGAFGMVGGQAVDLQTTGKAGHEPIQLEAHALRQMHAMKTGALITAAAAAGAIMGGGTDPQVAAIAQAASEFGLAFQIVDDILDVEGATAALGKTAGKDAAAGKPTYPSLYGLDASRSMARACLTRAEAALASADVSGVRLLDIGRWIVERTS